MIDATDALENLVEYVENQEEHHRNMSSKEELINLLAQHNIQYDPKYFD